MILINKDKLDYGFLIIEPGVVYSEVVSLYTVWFTNNTFSYKLYDIKTILNSLKKVFKWNL